MWQQNQKNHDFWQCSFCKHEAYWDSLDGQQLFDYCPYCGKKQRNYRQNTKQMPIVQYVMQEFERVNK